MKTLEELLNESLLDDEDDMIDSQSGVESVMIKDWIKKNYKIRYIRKHPYGQNGPVDFEINNRVVIAPEVSFALDNNSTALTNGLFKFGEVGRFNCTNCTKLKSLEGGPEKVKYDFECINCRSLKKLNGAPKHVGGSFDCSECSGLTDLAGAPEYVNDDFYCIDCKNLKSLKGLPKIINGDFVYDKSVTDDDKYIKQSNIGKIYKK